MTLERWTAAAVAAGLLLAAARLIRRRRRSGEPLIDTAVLFLGIWGISLGLFAIPVIDYITAGVGQWLMVYGSLAAFLAGVWLAKRRFTTTDPVPGKEVLSTKRVHIAWLFLGGLSLLGFAFFIRAIDLQVGWRSLFDDPEAARVAQGDPGFDDAYGIGKAFSYLGPVALLLWTVALRDGMFKGPWKAAAPLALVILIPYLFIGERLSLLTAIAWITMFHLIWRPIRNPRRVAIGAAVLFVAGISYFYAIGAQKEATIDDHPEIRAQMEHEVFEPVALPYLYWTANFPVFSELTQDPIAPTTYGQLSVLPAAKVVYKASGESPPVFGAFYEIPFDTYNSATWLGPFYTDFGLLGVLLLPALIAFLSTWALIEARRRRTLLSVWLAAIGLGMIVFSPLKSQLSDAITWELVLLAPIVAIFVAPYPGARASGLIGAARRRSPVSLRTGLAAAATCLAGLLVLVAFARLGSSEGVNDRSGTTDRINAIADDALLTYDRRGPATTNALTTQLQGVDPGTFFEELPSPEDEPAKAGAIGVYADPTGFRLRSRTDDGEIVEAIAFGAPGEFQLFPPRRPGPESLVANGDFEEAFGPPWFVTSGEGVQVTQTEDAFSGAYALKVAYDREAGSPPSAVLQGIKSLPRPAGTRFTVRQMVMPTDLTSQVATGFSFIFRDGTTRYVPSTAGSAPATSTRRATGVPAGSSADWIQLTASAVATKPVAAVQVFALDAGDKSLEGTVLVDDVVLAAGG